MTAAQNGGDDRNDNRPPPLRSMHTTNLSGILDQLGMSLLVTTYQAGKLVVVRRDEENPDLINTHFRNFNKPMGLAVGNQRLAIGAAQEIVEFRNVPAVAPRLEPAGKHDACFLPPSLHVTGDIQIHEMVYLGDELWFANTAFSCLCTYDNDHSFVPRWRPSFVTELTPEDRCHLNGLGLVDGNPRWVTALGETNTVGGWRENKKEGGILIDLDSEEIVTRGLSMPHSPRWYAGRLWVLESGAGSLGFVDLGSGRYESIVELPGFTQGLDFAGHLAFVGLSQVRETAVFSGIPITERLSEAERTCGVWAVDIRNGQVPGKGNRLGEVYAESYGEYPLSPRPGDRNQELVPRRSHRTLDVRTMDRRVSGRRARIGPLVGRDGGRPA